MTRLAIAALTLGLPFVVAAAEPASAPAIVLMTRRSEATPVRSGCTFVGGGTIDVQQPTADVVVVTMTGAVLATAHPCGSAATLAFDLAQDFEVVCPAGVRAARLTAEAQAVGLLRGGRTAAAAATDGCVTVTVGGAPVLSIAVPDRAVSGPDNLTINDRTGPEGVVVGPGPCVLHARWLLSAAHPKGCRGKAASAEFAPEPALESPWVGSPRDPFHGVGKKDFGLRVMLRVAAEPPAVE
ncbi:MAG TPA: hypothetical protein VGF55_07910 [Gemmataceae bacterium]|jgi:hypothetical protein